MNFVRCLLFRVFVILLLNLIGMKFHSRNRNVYIISFKYCIIQYAQKELQKNPKKNESIKNSECAL